MSDNLNVRENKVSLQSKLTYRCGVRLTGQPNAVVSQLLLQQHPQLHPWNSHQLGLALLILVCELGQLLTAAGGTRRRRCSLRLFVAGWPLGRRPRRLGADVVAVTVVCLLQRKVYTRGALLAEGLDRLQQASAVLLIEDADRVEIRIADLLADLKVVVAIVDKGLRVLAEVKRAQPLDHDVTRHGHLGTLVYAWARLRPRSFALLNLFPALARPLAFFSTVGVPFPPRCSPRSTISVSSPYPLYLAATISRDRFPDDVTSIETRGSRRNSIQSNQRINRIRSHVSTWHSLLHDWPRY